MLSDILRTAGYIVGLNSTAIVMVGAERRENEFGLTTANPFQMQKLFREMNKAGVEWVVMEVASHALVQHRTWGIKFETTIMTNLTHEHLDYHGTMEEYAKAKGKLFSNYPKLSVLNRDDKYYDEFSKYGAIQTLSYGTHESADCKIIGAKLGMRGTKLKLKLDEYNLDIKLNIPGRFNAYNALAAASAAYGMDISLDHIKRGLESVTKVPGRMELIEEGQEFVVVVDFAHTPDAMENILSTLRTTLKGRLITITGSAGARDKAKRTPMGKIAAENSEIVIITDDEPHDEDPETIRRQILKGTKSVEYGVVVKEIPDRREAMLQAFKYAKTGDVVAILGMGSQPYRMMNSGKLKWDDREVAKSLLKKL